MNKHRDKLLWTIQAHRYLFNICGLLSAIIYACVSLLNPDYEQNISLSIFLLSISLLFVFSILAFLASHFLKQFPLYSMLFWAVVFRLIGLTAFPIFEDDIFRYLWDGFQVVEYGSPYLSTPAEYFNDKTLPTALVDVLDKLAYPDISTIYGPLNQWSFALAYLVSPGQVWPLQVIYIICDLTVILILLKMAPARWVLLYAWSPLIIKEFSFTAHSDILGIMFLVLGIYFWKKSYFNWMAIALGFAVSSKIFALVIAPLLLAFRVRGWFIFLILWIMLYLPFWMQGWLNNDIGLTEQAGIAAMAIDWQFNASIYALFKLFLEPQIARGLSLFLFSAFWFIYAYIWYRDNSKIPRGDWLFGVFFLFSPVLNSWYLAWLLPFAVLFPSYWAWAASLFIFLSYITGLNLSDNHLQAFEQPLWAIHTQYLLIFVFVFYESIIQLYKTKVTKFFTLQKL